MDDAAEVVCAFCGSVMELIRKLPATADSHALRYFSCNCGAGQWRVVEAENGATPNPPGAGPI